MRSLYVKAMTDVVRGEASESDEESVGLNNVGSKIFASEISGEASESDEDVFEKKLISGASGTESAAAARGSGCNNLLQRKLIENNITIWRDLSSFVRNLVTAASNQLINTDQLLIKSQVSMQSALSSLKMAQGNVKLLHDKTNDVFTMNFIPNISIANTR